MQAYRDYVQASYELANKTAGMIRDFVDYDEAQSKAASLEAKLNLAASDEDNSQRLLSLLTWLGAGASSGCYIAQGREESAIREESGLEPVSLFAGGAALGGGAFRCNPGRV